MVELFSSYQVNHVELKGEEFSSQRLIKAINDTINKHNVSDENSHQETQSLSNNAPEFDVFLAHNSKDKPHVEQIAVKLKQRQLSYWIDTEQIAPGQFFQDKIQEAISKVKSAAIFIGLEGVGKWQEVELRSFISQCVEKKIPVIPVLLPDVEQIPENLHFLKQSNLVQFKDIDDEEAFVNLIWGITGKHPKRDP